MIALLLACVSQGPGPGAAPERAEVALHPELAAQSELFSEALLQPAPGVYVAVGHGLANVIALEGPEGLVIIDSGEGKGPATEALAAIRAHTQAPIRGLVLTHNHADHVFGGQVFVEEAGGDIPVWAHADTEAGIDRVVNVLRDAIYVRSARMFGSALPEDPGGGTGIGFALRFDAGDIALARPTHTFTERVTLELAGLELELVHAPGETADQLFVWWPERRVLLPADNIYQAFPNLYTIRGTPYRDIRAWVDSLDTMRDLAPEHLVPQHGRPVSGEAEVMGILTAYRDAIQYVHDQSVRGMNRGLTPDALAEWVRLPPHLAEHPWLREHYGRVPWSVRAVYAGQLGWFSGEAATLEPQPPEERARRYALAFEAGLPLGEQVQAALRAGEWSWAAELALLRTQAEPESEAARQQLAQAYEALAQGHINANARRWYLTEALELRGELRIDPAAAQAAPVALIDGLPLTAFMQALPTRLIAEDTLDVDWTAVFRFSDEQRIFVMHVRRGVAELRERSEAQVAGLEPDLELRTTARLWRRVLAGHASATQAIAAGELEVEGGPTELLRLLRWFEG
ncbi:MAG: MBL fold metallo-hydrolase [Alphaproteobacteria bacterium]|nr:MBL fold metallo-hydrolase [Alphaproteobacteria bacterium]